MGFDLGRFGHIPVVAATRNAAAEAVVHVFPKLAKLGRGLRDVRVVAR